MARYSADKIKVRLLKAWMRRLYFQDIRWINYPGFEQPAPGVGCTLVRRLNSAIYWIAILSNFWYL